MTHPIHLAHTAFLTRVLEKPARIPLRGADETDVRDRDTYIRNLTGAYLKFVEALASDLNENLPVGSAGKIGFPKFLREFTANAQANIYEPMGEAVHVVERNREG